MIGTSGAAFTVTKETGAQFDETQRRLMYQEKWLASHSNNEGIVRVLGGTARGYKMEYLLTPEWPLRHPVQMARDIITILKEVWVQPAWAEPWQPNEYFERVTALYPPTRAWFRSIQLPAPEYCDTHGDPTLENALLDPQTGKVKLVDPLLDPVIDGKVPSIRALDLGKLLQSATGYERVKRGLITCWSPHDRIVNLIRAVCRSPGEWELTRWFCLFHILRFIPYQSPEDQRRWKAWLPGIEAWLLSTSMTF